MIKIRRIYQAPRIQVHVTDNTRSKVWRGAGRLKQHDERRVTVESKLSPSVLWPLFMGTYQLIPCSLHPGYNINTTLRTGTAPGEQYRDLVLYRTQVRLKYGFTSRKRQAHT